jgi:hypothetical protein
MTLITVRPNLKSRRRWSVDWNLTMWALALVVTLTILFMHLASQIPERSPSETGVRTSAMATR